MNVRRPWYRIRSPRVVVAAIAVAVLAAITTPAAQAASGSSAAAAAPGSGGQTAHPTSPAADFGPGAAASDDIAVNAFGDGLGYHIQVGSEKSGFTWHEAALLRPDGLDDSSWTGYQCTSGDGRYEAVAVLPMSAVNNTSALEHGAFAYSVDLQTGKVRPIATGVALRYFSPGCGTGDLAAFTVSLGDQEQTTEILTANLATGAVEYSTTVAGELTSAVPAPGGLVVASGSDLVSVPEVNGQAKATKIAAAGGEPFELRVAADGGVDFLSMTLGASTATVMHEHAGHAVALGAGAASTLALFQGRGGHNTVVGASSLAKGSSLRLVGIGSLGTVSTASLDGDALLGDQQQNTNPDNRILSTATGHIVTQAPATTDAPVSEGYSSLVPAGVPAASGQASLAAPAPAQQKAAAPGAPRPDSVEAPVIEPATAQTPACAVPRLAPTLQAVQPGSAQVDWAVQMAEQGLLTGAQYTRPADFDDMGLAAYAPSSDFPPHLLDSPSSWNTVPRSVFEAIMAQESNWDQASWHALPGLSGDPIVADYYGAAGSISTINYSAADCGYGISQVTTGMSASETGQEYSLHGQEKIAVDYQENIAAGLQILEDTWNELYSSGITINGGDPRYLEDWYYAIWAYNTGIEPNAAHGNTTGCTPSPSCTGPDGTWGLGWANNPANSVFPPNRQPYLKTTYADAAHPGDWPYQERVLGWMGSPLNRMGSAAYAKPAYNGGETWLQIPNFSDFCTTAEDDCTPPAEVGQSGTCTLADSDCWWHLPDAFVQNCPATCATSAYAVGSGSSEPPVTDPHPPVCSLDTTAVPTTSSGAPIIVSAQVGLGDGATPLNDVGCPAAENWSNNGSFTMSYGTDSNGDPIGAVDTHQLGAGFGGYIMFTHTEDGSNTSLINVGTWTPNLPSLQYYTIMAHIPATGARSTDAEYLINSGNAAITYPPVYINQDIGTDSWVSLGTFGMQNGGGVQLTNLSQMAPGDYDVGYDAVAFVPRGGTPSTGGLLGGNPTISQAPGGINPAFLNCTCGSTQAGDPVDTGTGYFSQTDTDLSTPGRGMPLDFARTYASALADPHGPNSALTVNGPFGYGWTFSYGLSTTTDAATGDVTVDQEDGSTVAFTDSGGTYSTAVPRFDATLAKSGGSYIYTRRGTDVFTFDVATGRLTSETDLAGENASTPYATTLAYNSSGQLSTITDPADHVYTLSWTGSHISSLSDSAGREVSYGYDAAGDLTDIYGVATVRSPSLENNDHTTFTYNTTTHLLTGVRQPKYYGDTTTSPTPTPAMSMIYDSSDRVTSQTDATGHTTTFAYGPSSSPSLAAGQTLTTDPSGHETLDTYQNGLLTSETKGYGTSVAGTTSYTYDPATVGISTQTDPNGGVETFTYDSRGNLTSKSNGLGETTAYTYDSLGDLTETVDPLGIETVDAYDQAGHIVTASGTGTNSGALVYGLETSQTVTQLQQSAEIVDSNPAVLPSRTTDYYYDDAAHPSDRTRAVDANGYTTTTTYDAYGNVASVKDPDNDVTEYGYNTGTGWKTSEVTANGVAAGVGPSCVPPAKGCTTYAYDPYGRLTLTTDPLGHTKQNTYDADGNLLTSTDGNKQTTVYGYDAANRQTAVTNPDGTISQTDYNPDGTIADTIDPAAGKTVYHYDGQGRKSSQTDPDNRTTSFTYDKNGNTQTITDPSSRVTTNGYDAANELTSVKYSDGTTPDVNYTYDEDGLRTSMTDGTGTTTWSYDAFKEVVSETNGAGSTIGYGYDNDGDTTSITYPGGQAETVTQGYDHADRLNAITDWNGNATSFGYDADGNETTTTYPNGVKITDGYDNGDNLTSITATDAGTTLAEITYTRDNANQIAGVSVSGLPGNALTYNYTQLEQLKSATDATTNTNYTYNAAGDTTSAAGTAQAFDEAGQLCWSLPGSATSSAACTAPPTGAITYTYNSEGDRTSTTPSGAGTSTYTFDQADDLTDATGPTSNATYTYDGDGLRATKTVGTTTTIFTWSTDTAENLLSDGTEDYVYGPDSLPIEQIGASSTTWFMHDANGSTRALFAANGTIAAAYGYDAYGNTTHTGSATTPLQYTGAYTDAETGFVYLHARYYDPATTQFLSVDPAVDLTDQPYAYADDSPLEKNDPLGLWTGGLCIGTEDAAFFGFAVTGCIVFDGHGGIGLEGTYTPVGSFYGSPASGVAITGQYSTGNTINSLGGPFSTAGGSFEPVAEGPSIAADASWGTDAHGCQVGVLNEGVGLGGTFPPFGEVHGGSSDTGVIGTTFSGLVNDTENFFNSLF